MQRIHDYNPSIKLIILLRNPIDRAFSHWNMQRDRKLDSLDFLDAVKQEENRAREVYPLQLRKYSYVERGFYSEQMERTFRFFPRDRVLVIKFDDLVSLAEKMLPKLEVEIIPGQRQRSAKQPMVIEKAKQVLGWTPEYNMEAGFKDYIEELKALG